MDEMTTQTYVVDGMSCGHCRAAVEGEVRSLDGVTEAAVDLDASTLTVSGRGVSAEAVARAVDEAGYSVRR